SEAIAERPAEPFGSAYEREVSGEQQARRGECEQQNACADCVQAAHERLLDKISGEAARFETLIEERRRDEQIEERRRRHDECDETDDSRKRSADASRAKASPRGSEQ